MVNYFVKRHFKDFLTLKRDKVFIKCETSHCPNRKLVHFDSWHNNPEAPGHDFDALMAQQLLRDLEKK
jgi:hypothetical protein